MGADGTTEVLTMGRLGVDIYPLQTGVSLREVTTFGKFLGGTAANVAVAAARYGRRAGLISRTGTDPFGEYLHDALRDFGVDDRLVTPCAGLPTPVTFCEIFPPDDFPLYFYRLPTAPDLQLRAEELDLDAVRAAEVFWVTGTGLSAEPSRAATLTALRARAQARGPEALTVLDLDYRPMFWASRDAAREALSEALPLVSVAVGNQDEVLTAVGTRDPREAAAALHAAGVRLAVIKQGPKGVLASRLAGEGNAGAGNAGDGAAGDGSSGDGAAEQVEVPPVPVEVVNGLGAGDAFGGALCHGLLAGWALEDVMRFANAAGALVASRLACADAMPAEAEVRALLGEPAHA